MLKPTNQSVKQGLKLKTILFIGIICVPVFYVLLFGQKEISQRENRRLALVPDFSFQQFSTSEYQNNLEAAMKDQAPLAEDMKRLYNAFKRDTTTFLYVGFDQLVGKASVSEPLVTTDKEEIEIDSSDDDHHQEDIHKDQDVESENHYLDISLWDYNLIPMGSDVLKIQSTGHLIMPSNTKEQWQPLIDSKVANINALALTYPDLNFHVYYIETDHDVDFTNRINDHSIRDYYADALVDSVTFASQDINQLTDLTDYYFATDHHWNMNGQLLGYHNIMKLLDKEPSDLVELVTLEAVGYIGSKAKRIDDFTFQDTFGYLINRELTYTVTVNEKDQLVNQKMAYDQGYYSLDEGVNHYALCYGYDMALIHYDFNQPEADNLLVFAASFSNPINELIASHYNNTYVIDLRHYERDMGETFDFSKFVASHQVDDVLITGYYSFHANDGFLIN